jgi:hypothetical protein
MASPCRISTEHPNPDPPTEVPRKKETMQHTYHISMGPLKKHVIHTVQKPLNKMASRYKFTKDRQLLVQKLGVYKIPCSCGKVFICQTGNYVPPGLQNTSDTRLENQ